MSVSRAACATAAGLNAPHAVRLVAQFVVCGVSAHESHAAASAQRCGRSMPPRKCDMTVRAHGVVVSHPLCMRKALGSIPSVSTCGCVRGFVVVSLRRRCGAGASVWRKCKAQPAERKALNLRLLVIGRKDKNAHLLSTS